LIAKLGKKWRRLSVEAHMYVAPKRGS